MKKIIVIIFIFYIHFIPTVVHAQINPIKQFSEDPIKFLDDIKVMLEATSMDKKEIKEYIEQFSLAWNTPKCNDAVKTIINETSNLMVKKRIRILPEFKSYLTSVKNFINSTQTEANFLAWQSSITKILNGKSLKNYTDYLAMSENLFLTNTFYKSSVVEYKSNNNNYLFEFDSLPKVVFQKMNLSYYNNQNDSGVVYNTKGVYYPNKGLFIGEGGKVDWKRAKIEDNVVWAELKKYKIILKTSGFLADSVVFYNKNYFQKPLLGQLNEKVISESGDNVSYPRFDSYNKRMQIPNIAKDVDYDGGFSMKGAKFIGSGNKELDALLIFKRESKPFLIIGAKTIAITQEKFTAENANTKFYFGKDSITHPSLSFKFILKDRFVSLIRSSDGISKSPFLNSYHKLDMYFEELAWKIDDPKIDLRMLIGNAQEDGMFESANYFRGDRYDKIQGVDPMNPLIQMREFVQKQNGGDKNFKADKYAHYLKFSLNDVRPNLVRLAALGFITYDMDDDIVHVEEKLYTYIAAKAGHIDYDVMQFPSEVRGASNATINLLNYDMTIFGIKQIFMSDSQNVTIYPAEQKILLKKNRDFLFAGVISAGRFDFFGKEFSFDYDKFKIELKNVDSLRIRVKQNEPNAYGEYPIVKVKTVIEKINGSLEIDNPANKSGRKSFPSYPIFTSLKDSYAYYDKRSILNGKYKRDNFYFHLDPFVIDSLDNFTNAGLTFKGEFVSADIFPKFRETLTLQTDYSLGFITQTPPAGYPMYGDKGTYNSAVKLSNKGLRGDGILHYVTSTIKSNDFIFYPDSTSTVAQEFDVKEQISSPEFPQIHGEEVKILWKPYKDVLFAYNKRDKKFLAYNGQSDMTGSLSLTPKQLYGSGTTDFGTAKLDAKLIKFKSKSFDSDTANFSLKAMDIGGIAFSTDNVSAHIDFAKRVGEFKSNGKGSIVRFPVNKYICFMDKFKWLMDDGSVELGSDKPVAADAGADLNLSGPEFISVHEDQDSLKFYSPAARYDLKKYIITAREVQYINVADARIYPDKGDITIEKNALMRTLNNAKIVANSITKYHTLYNCIVNIFARKKYSGSGSYDYIDELKNVQTFHFSNISVDSSFQTFAETSISEDTKFNLSPNFQYKGKVKLKSSNNYLVFDGATRISHDCAAIPKTWFKFEAEINPNLIYIPIGKDLRDASDNSIASSLMVTTDSTHFYSAFLSPKSSPNDAYVLPADGFLFFDKGAREYRISNKEKLVERSLPGNYLSLNTAQCKVYGEGNINLGGDLGQVKIESFGSATHLLIPDSTTFDLFTSIDFFFDDGAINKMADAIAAATELKPTDFSRVVFEKGMREKLGKEQADKLISQLNLYGTFKKFPDELNKTIYFTDLRMKWNKETRSYTSSGKMGVGNIHKTQINKYVDGKVELVKKRGGDVLNIYLEVDPNNWYYFNYTRGTMLAVSSNEAFNNMIKDLKPDKREVKGDKDKKEPNYYFNICPPSKKTQFLRKTQSTEEGEK